MYNTLNGWREGRGKGGWKIKVAKPSDPAGEAKRKARTPPGCAEVMADLYFVLEYAKSYVLALLHGVN